MSAVLGIWTVYDHPSDYPDGFIARLHEVLPGGVHRATAHTVMAPSLDEVRELLPHLRYRMRIDRHPSDDPVIVESWI